MGQLFPIFITEFRLFILRIEGHNMGLFSHDDPYDEYADEISQIPGAISPYYQPYIDAGTDALNTLNPLYQNMLGNYGGLQQGYNAMFMHPDQVLNQMMSGYSQSPYYDYELEQGENAIGAAEAAGGMAGTPEHAQKNASLAENLANQYMQEYLKNAEMIGRGGMRGKQQFLNMGTRGEEGIYKSGMNASNQMAQAIADAMSSQAQAQYGSTSTKNRRMGRLVGDVAGLGAMMFL